MGEIKNVTLNPKKSSPRAKSSTRETSLFGGQHTMIATYEYLYIFSLRLPVIFFFLNSYLFIYFNGNLSYAC